MSKLVKTYISHPPENRLESASGHAIFPVHRARHREADPLVPGRPQGQRAQLPERGDERRHPEVSAIKRETLICSVKCKFALFLCL